MGKNKNKKTAKTATATKVAPVVKAAPAPVSPVSAPAPIKAGNGKTLEDYLDGTVDLSEHGDVNGHGVPESREEYLDGSGTGEGDEQWDGEEEGVEYEEGAEEGESPS